MRRPEPAETVESSGQDSFLDVVTNIVGILIILVMVSGMRAKSMPLEIASPSAPVDGLEKSQASAAELAADVQRLDDQLARADADLAARRQDEDKIEHGLAADRQQLDHARSEVAERDRQDAELQKAVLKARGELARKQQEYESYVNYEAPATEIKCFSTPISRAVTGHEVHFHLKHGRIAHVPMDELVDQMVVSLKGKFQSPADVSARQDPIGPLDGFYMNFALDFVPDRSGGGRSSIRVRRAKFTPAAENIGETVPQAFAPQSAFRQTLGKLEPRTDAVTIWFYADSFAEFRVFNQELHRLGFATAGRPLPDGASITASPDGTRSRAE